MYVYCDMPLLSDLYGSINVHILIYVLDISQYCILLPHIAWETHPEKCVRGAQSWRITGKIHEYLQ